MKISIDTGKSQTKVSYYNQGTINNFMFLSNVAEGVTTNATTEEAVKIKYGKTSYLVGEYGFNTYADNAQDISKETQVHKILVITAIVKVLERVKRPDVLEVEIAVNIPLTLFKMEGKKESTQDFYKNNGVYYDVELEGKKYSFKTSNVVTYFEGIGTILLNHSKYKNSEVLSLDLGSFNLGYATFNKNKPVGVLSGSLNEGINKLMAKVDDILIINNLSYLTKNNVHDIIKGTYAIKDDVKKEIDKECINHVKALKTELVKRNINVTLPIIASGGGAVLLDKYLMNEFMNFELAENFLYSNSDAGLILLK